MKGRVVKTMGIVTLIVETLTEIKPTEPLIFDKRSVHGRNETAQIP